VPQAVAVLVLLVAGLVRHAGAQATLSPEQQAQFLLTARVGEIEDIGKGVTRPVRVTLTDGTLTHDAAFSSIEERMPVMKYKDGRTELDFVDSYKYSIAAYRLAVLLGLDHMMPVTVERKVDGRKGALSWWVDGVKMDEGQRRVQQIRPPDLEAWSRQMFRMRVFTQLVADTDRNTGNVLITHDWKLWMIDFTRAFRRARTLPVPEDVTRCDRQLLEKLRALTKGAVAEHTKPFIGGSEIDAVLARRDALVSLIDKLVATRGEAVVLY
jgi:hypothetical protein